MIQFMTSPNLFPVLGGALLFVAVILLVMGVSTLVEERQLFGSRLALGRQTAADAKPTKIATLSLDDGLLKQFDRVVSPSNIKELAAIRRRLIRAGYRGHAASRVYFAAKAGLSLALAFISAIVLLLGGFGLDPMIIGLIVMFSALVGYMLPSFWIERKIEYRKQEAEYGFPDMLDMLLVCIESGNSIDQGCRRVAKEIGSVNQVLSEELTVAIDELRAGKDRAMVFRDFAERLAVPDIAAFATVLRQSDEFGVSIADTLRVYASEMRNKRVVRAEAKANLMPLQLAIGTLVFTVPPAMLIMAGPSVINILRAFQGMGH